MSTENVVLVKRGSSPVKKICKTLFLLACLGVCSYQVVDLLVIFFNYPSNVLVSKEEDEKLTLPGITLCNSNSIKLTNLFNLTAPNSVTDFETEWKKLNGTGNNLDKQKLIDETLRRLLQNSTAAHLVNMGPQFENLLRLKNFKCASDLVNNNTACREMVEPLVTAQDIGNCFTLFHGSRRAGKDQGVDSIAIESGYGQSPVITGSDTTESVKLEVSEQPFQPNEIIRFRMSFNHKEYTAINDPVYGTITIHDPTEAPDTRMRRKLVQPGRYYEFYIKKQISELLPSPFKSACFDYVKENTKKYKDKGPSEVHPYLDAPLSRDDCIIGCLANATIQKCGCWPQELPFIAGFDDRHVEAGALNYTFRKTKLCDWASAADPHLNEFFVMTTFSDKAQAFRECFSNHEEACQTNCPKDCLITRFLVDIQSFKWPATERITHSSDEKHAEKLKRLNQCCSTISIRYWDSEKETHSHQPKFAPIEFISYMGGLISLWLGFSFLGLYDTLRDWVLFARKQWNFCRRNKRDKERRQSLSHRRPNMPHSVRKKKL